MPDRRVQRMLRLIWVPADLEMVRIWWLGTSGPTQLISLAGRRLTPEHVGPTDATKARPWPWSLRRVSRKEAKAKDAVQYPWPQQNTGIYVQLPVRQSIWQAPQAIGR